MIHLTISTNDELLQKLAVYSSCQKDFDAIITEILRRIAKQSKVTQSDRGLIDKIVKKLKSIEDEDFDLPHQSKRSRYLSKQYFNLKQRLLKKMSDKTSIKLETICFSS